MPKWDKVKMCMDTHYYHFSQLIIFEYFSIFQCENCNRICIARLFLQASQKVNDIRNRQSEVLINEVSCHPPYITTISNNRSFTTGYVQFQIKLQKFLEITNSKKDMSNLLATF